MKKLLIAGLTLISMSSQAGLFDSIATSDFPTIKTETKYKVETYGFDVRVVEWTPKYNKNISCVFVRGSSSNSSGVACYPKSKVSK